MNKVLMAIYSGAIAIPFIATFFGLNLAEVREVLATDFVVTTILASYLGLKPPAPPVDPAPPAAPTA